MPLGLRNCDNRTSKKRGDLGSGRKGIVKRLATSFATTAASSIRRAVPRTQPLPVGFVMAKVSERVTGTFGEVAVAIRKFLHCTLCLWG